MPGPGTWSPGDVLTAADLNAIGVWETYSPTLVQNGTRTCTVNYASYVVINKFCQVNLDLTCTTSGSSGNIITVSLPLTASTTGATDLSLGGGIFYDDSASDVILVTPVFQSSTTVRLMTDSTTSRTGGLGANPSLALANNDVISLSFQYRVA